MLPALLLPAPLQAPKPFAAAQRLASSANGIAAAPRPVLAARSKQQQQAAAAPALEVVAADGPRGMKLKSRKASRLRAAGWPCVCGAQGMLPAAWRMFSGHGSAARCIVQVPPLEVCCGCCCTPPAKAPCPVACYVQTWPNHTFYHPRSPRPSGTRSLAAAR